MHGSDGTHRRPAIVRPSMHPDPDDPGSQQFGFAARDLNGRRPMRA